MEIVLRALVIFLFLWVVTRSVGRSTLGELSTFELLLYVTMGDLVQQAVTSQDYSLTAGILAISTIALLTVLLSWLQWRFPRSRPLISGRPVLVMRDGELIAPAMKRVRLGVEDILVSMREQGIRHASDIEFAILEADGRLSLFERQHEDDSGAPEKPSIG
ncbi:MAG: DUF421 domain-containing protein [Marmoricola sp.]|nr:DUF421 domain-containing protein [Marmoricola sp.]